MPGEDSVRLHEDRLDAPARWRKPRRVFVCSMADLYHESVPDAYIARVWQAMAAADRHTFIVLTKRAERMASWAAANPRLLRAHVWMGVSVESQRWAEARLPHLVSIPAAVRFASVEPLLRPVDLTDWLPYLDWVIVGGESGPRARPMEYQWVRDIRDDCQDAEVAFFFKQWGGVRPTAKGRILDMRTHDDYPTMDALPQGVLL